MKEINRINRGFEAMIPKNIKPKEDKVFNNNISFSFFKKRVTISFEVKQEE